MYKFNSIGMLESLCVAALNDDNFSISILPMSMFASKIFTIITCLAII